MALRPIRTVGEPVLRRKARDVDRIDTYITQLLNDMADTMYQNKGVGLAANQIGVLKKLIVVDVGDGLMKLINPKILKKEGSEVCSEACLSIPGVMGDVERATEITVKAMDENHKNIEIAAAGFLARCLQHEIDHLNGTLFIDKATNIREGCDAEGEGMEDEEGEECSCSHECDHDCSRPV